MIRVDCANLPNEIQEHLNLLQQAVDQQTPDAMSWKDFSTTDMYQSLKSELRDLFHGKCAYCESAGASDVEHHWPKSPHPHNANRGSTSRMFLLSNMILACSTCNGFQCKASHMEWMTDGSPMLLNPSVAADDPLCYFTIMFEQTPSFAIGWIDPRPIPTTLAYRRAEYTIRRLKLNTRDHLVRARARVINSFLAYAALLLEHGPDFEAPSGRPLRNTLLQMLDAWEPYLSPIRQILYFEPEYAGLKDRLLAQMPEIGPILTSWALPPPDCSQLIREAL